MNNQHKTAKGSKHKVMSLYKRKIKEYAASPGWW